MSSLNPYRLAFLLLVGSYWLFILISLNYPLLSGVNQNALLMQLIAITCTLISVLLVWRGSIKKTNQ